MRRKSFEVKIDSAKSVALRKMHDGWRLSLPDNSISGSYWVHVKRLRGRDIEALYELLREWKQKDGGEEVHSDARRDDPLGSR